MAEAGSDNREIFLILSGSFTLPACGGIGYAGDDALLYVRGVPTPWH